MNYFGECGKLMVNDLQFVQIRSYTHTAAVAIEIWCFNKNSSKIKLSHFLFYPLQAYACNQSNYKMEAHLVAEFVSKTKASPTDALSCLRTWGWDLKKALIDYNGKFMHECEAHTVLFVLFSHRSSNGRRN